MRTPKRQGYWHAWQGCLVALLCAMGLTVIGVQPARAQQTGNFGAVVGTAYIDLNGNQTQDANELGLAGVSIELRSATYVDSTTTAADGTYEFLGLFTPDTYTVHVVIPDGYASTTPGEVEVSLDVNQSVTVNFGFQEAAIITGVIFNDANRNGIQDPDEPGVPGVTVRAIPVEDQAVTMAWTAQDNADPVVTVTDSEGRFTFSLLAGVYQLEADLPPDFAPIGGIGQIVTAEPGQTVEVDVEVIQVGLWAFLPNIMRLSAAR